MRFRTSSRSPCRESSCFCRPSSFFAVSAEAPFSFWSEESAFSACSSCGRTWASSRSRSRLCCRSCLTSSAAFLTFSSSSSKPFSISLSSNGKAAPGQGRGDRVHGRLHLLAGQGAGGILVHEGQGQAHAVRGNRGTVVAVHHAQPTEERPRRCADRSLEVLDRGG